MDRIKAAIPSKPVPKQVSNLNKPALLRDQQNKNNQITKFESNLP